MSILNWINFEPKGDERGDLVALEQGIHVPFVIKRIYYIYRTERGVSRGFHAHRNLKQILICLNGSVKILLDNGNAREQVLMDNPTKGLLIESMFWREMHEFSHDCVLLVLASEHYNEADYIRNYQEFLDVRKTYTPVDEGGSFEC